MTNIGGLLFVGDTYIGTVGDWQFAAFMSVFCMMLSVALTIKFNGFVAIVCWGIFMSMVMAFTMPGVGGAIGLGLAVLVTAVSLLINSAIVHRQMNKERK